jgi:ABC-type nitrate/sulfonate/bicarbonate transport system permease component
MTLVPALDINEIAAPPRRRRVRAADLLRSRLSGAGLIVVLLILWELSATRGWIVSDNWPPVSAVLRAGYQGLFQEDLASTLGATLSRTLAGYGLGCVLGAVLGLLLGVNRWLDWAIRPWIEIQRTLPSPAIIPPLILFLGIDDGLKIFIVLLAVFPPVFINTYGGVRGLDETLLLTARTFGLGRFATLRKIVLPATLPAMTAGMRTALSLALIMAVIGEMIAGSSGIGNYLMTMQYAMRADAMYASVMCLALSGYILNRIFLLLERAVLRWHFAMNATE